MNKTLNLFKIFHKIKTFTTMSYSMKKFQDLIERKLNASGITKEEFREILNQTEELTEEIQNSLDELRDLIATERINN